MEKPFSLIVQETEEKIIKVVNDSNLPAYCLKKILENLYQQISNLDDNQIKEYLQNETSEKKSKEDDK